MTYIAELSALRMAFIKSRKQGGRFTFSDELKAKAVDLWEKGCSVKDICEYCALCKSQLYQWRAVLKRPLKKPENFIQEIPIVTESEQFIQKKQNYFFVLKISSLKITWAG